MWKELFLKIKTKIKAKVGLSGKKETPIIQPKPNRGEKNPALIKIRYFLLKDQKPVGKAYSRRHPEIRILSANSFTDAYTFFVRLCDQRLLTVNNRSGHLYYTVTLGENTGKIELSDNTKGSEAIAILQVNIPEIEPHLSEIRFMKTDKCISCKKQNV